jgi:predicted nucleotidyltransferase
MDRYLRSAVRLLRRSYSIRTILLIGSQARGDVTPQSDIDIVVVLKSMVSLRKLSESLPQHPFTTRVSILPFADTMFRFRYKLGSLFIRHVVEEGRLLYDDGFYKRLRENPLPNSRKDSMRELEGIRRRLELYNDPSMFNGLYMDYLIRIYRLATEIMIISSALRGKPIYNKREALGEFIRAHPSLEREARSLARLEPFYMVGVRHSNRRLPFSPTNTEESEITGAVSNLRKVLGAVQYE